MDPLGTLAVCAFMGFVVPLWAIATRCTTAAPGLIYVYLNSTIVPSEYAFAMYVIPPVETPVAPLHIPLQ